MSLVYTAENRNRLYVGGKSDAKNREKLEQWGVKYILNVTTPKEAGMQQSGVPNFFEKDKKTFVYKRIPVYDTSTSASDLLGYADGIVDFISKGLHHGSVLVHCNMGQSRSTTATIFFLIRKANMSMTKALEMIQRRRPLADPIPAFREILETYQTRCEKERQGADVDKDQSSEVKKKRGPSGDNHQGQEKRRKAGPSIGPSMGPDSRVVGPQLEPAANKIGPSIGPSQPTNKKVVGPSIGPSIGPSMPPTTGTTPTAKASIGPSLPPTTAVASSSKDVSTSSSSTKKKKVIGPSLPPPS